MKVINILISLLFCLQAESYSYGLQQVRGVILDGASGSPLPAVRVVATGRSHFAISDSMGEFGIEPAEFPVTLSFSLGGYREESILLHAPVDTVLRTYLHPLLFTLGEVVVTSTRLPQSPFNSPASIRVLSRPDIDRASAASLADLLSPIEGLFVKNYGGGSGAKTISQRGMGSEHTLILLNGMRISNSQNGLVDLGLMSADDIDRIEVIHGGQSASYGADAIAGVINIVPAPIPSRGTIRAASTIGSFGYRRYQVSGGLTSGSAGLRMYYGEEESDEDFPFLFRNGATVSALRRRNADVSARFANLRASFSLGAESSINAFASIYRSERGAGGPVVGPSSFSRARQDDEDDILQVGFASNLPAESRLTTNVQVRNAYQRYHDPDLVVANIPLNTYFSNREIRLEPGFEIQLSDVFRLASGFDLAHITSGGNSMKSGRRRTQAGAYVTAEHRFRSDGTAIAEVALFPALRYDAAGPALRATSPQLGVLVSFRELEAGGVKRLRPAVRASVARNFRPPTFNELFFHGGGGVGNPDLQPERSTSFDAGVNLTCAVLGDHMLQGTYFLNVMSGRIVWVAAGSGSVTPKNLRSVRAEGFGGSYRWSLPGKSASLELNYTNGESRKTSADYPGDPNVNAQLIYIPQESFNFSLSIEETIGGSVLTHVGGTFTNSFVGYRYYTEDNIGFLPSYQVAAMNIRARLSFPPITGLVKCEINNLFDEDYQVIIGYPMPGRSFRVTLGVEY